MTKSSCSEKRIRLIEFLFKEEINRAERNWYLASLNSLEFRMRKAQFSSMSEIWRTEIQDIFCFILDEFLVGTSEHWNKKLFWNPCTNVTSSYWPKFIEFRAPIVDDPIGEMECQILPASGQLESFWGRENDIHKDFSPNLKWNWWYNRLRAAQTHAKTHLLSGFFKSISKPYFFSIIFIKYGKTFWSQKPF